jgi:hypothetical protein
MRYYINLMYLKYVRLMQKDTELAEKNENH